MYMDMLSSVVPVPISKIDYKLITETEGGQYREGISQRSVVSKTIIIFCNMAIAMKLHWNNLIN